jgi:hypothetical protein
MVAGFAAASKVLPGVCQPGDYGLQAQATDRYIHFYNFARYLHCNKRLAIFPSPAGISLTKLSLAENNLIIPDQGEFG